MTEYDYSPDAYERHLATQQKIALWVDQTREHSPCNPFEPSESSESTTTKTPQSLALYATPQDDTPPTYSNSRTHEHSQWHSPSRRSSPLILMPQARPPFSRSFSSPQPSAGQLSPLKPYPPYPTTPSRIPSPYTPSRIPSPYTPRYQPSPMPHRSGSSSQKSFHSPHICANSAIQQQYGGNTYPYYSPSIPQPMVQQQPVVVVNGDRFTVLPPPGQHVQVYSSTQRRQKSGSKSKKFSRNRYY